MSKSNFLSWSKWFIKQVNKIRNDENLQGHQAILVLDGHSSRENPEALKLLKENNIRVEVMPSHCSHIFQPLDLSCFGPFKVYLKKSIRKYKNMELTNQNEKGEKVEMKKTEISRFKIVLSATEAL